MKKNYCIMEKIGGICSVMISSLSLSSGVMFFSRRVFLRLRPVRWEQRSRCEVSVNKLQDRSGSDGKLWVFEGEKTPMG